MAITSYGYDGTLTEVGWASLSELLGLRRGVKGAADWAVSIGAGTREVLIAAGVAFGGGVADVNSANVSLSATAVSSGTRWDTVVVRRNWSTNTTTALIVAGTSSKAVASGLNSNPGVLDDQVIALIRLTSASTAVQEVLDMRSYPGRSLVYGSATALGLDPGPFSTGQLASVVDASQVARLYGRTAAGAWSPLDGPASSADWSALSLSSTLTTYDITPAYIKRNGIVHIRGTVKLTSGNDFTAGQLYSVATLPTGFRPASGQVHNYATAASVAGSGVPARARVLDTGNVGFIAPNAVPWVAIDTSFLAEA